MIPLMFFTFCCLDLNSYQFLTRVIVFWKSYMKELKVKAEMKEGCQVGNFLQSLISCAWKKMVSIIDFIEYFHLYGTSDHDQGSGVKWKSHLFSVWTIIWIWISLENVLIHYHWWLHWLISTLQCSLFDW